MINYNEPIYDPFNKRGPTYYHPANDAAINLIAIQLIYRDIEVLFLLYKEAKENHVKKLIAKYIIIEILSADRYICNLVNKIVSGTTGYIIESDLLLKVKKLYKQYKDAKKKKQNDLIAIRNKLGAHRDQLDLLTISELWDKIDFKAISEIVRTVPPLFNFIKDLNVYCWTKKGYDENEEEVIAIIQPIDYSNIKFIQNKNEKE